MWNFRSNDLLRFVILQQIVYIVLFTDTNVSLNVLNMLKCGKGDTSLFIDIFGEGNVWKVAVTDWRENISDADWP